ncbi:MAG: antibiotic biosynthesis monooxygenase [Agarilytica sp.]
MFAVIFRAKSGVQDKDYYSAVEKMRELAFSKYACKEFVSVTEGKQEIAISYWESETAIKAWKNDAEHMASKELGRSKWYESYIVQVVEIKHEYGYAG